MRFRIHIPTQRDAFSPSHPDPTECVFALTFRPNVAKAAVPAGQKKCGRRRLTEGASSLPLFYWRHSFRAGLPAVLRHLSARCCARFTSRSSFCFVNCGAALSAVRCRSLDSQVGGAGQCRPLSLSPSPLRWQTLSLPAPSSFFLVPSPRATVASNHLPIPV